MTIAPPTKAFGVPFEPLSIDETALAREYAPSAFGGFFGDEMRPRPYTTHGDVAVVTVEGPLDTRAGWWCDGYDEIVARAAMALADPKVKALVLALDSPGGMAAGNLDAARTLYALAQQSTKPVVAHAGTMACSAAYALACAADAIHLTADGVVGSIGTIATVYDRTEANELRGLNVKVVRSGTLKADPHPDVALTDASVARVRARINELAGMFSAWVAERRPTMGDPLTLQGASVYGADAVAKGVADQVGTLADAITTAASMAADSAARTKEKTMDANALKSLETFATLRAALNVATDEEAVATVATLRQRAAQVEPLTAEVTTLRAQLTERDTATLAAARQAVLDKHLQRGGLTPAMQGDKEYMADLAPLSPEALDRVLAKLPTIPGADGTVKPREASAVDPTGAAIDPATITLTDDDRTFARAARLTDEAFLAIKRADAVRAAAHVAR